MNPVNYLDLLTNGKVSFSKLLRAVNSIDAAKDFFEQTGVLRLKFPKCKCGVKGECFFGKNKDSSTKCGFRWRCKICGIRLNPFQNTWFENSHLNYLQVNFHQFKIRKRNFELQTSDLNVKFIFYRYSRL